MIRIRPASERGHSKLDWLESRHTFSFADYQDPRHMGISNLRVINDDVVAPGARFRHPRAPRHGDRELRA